MIIPRHKVCDFCKQSVGVNKRYFKIKSKNYLIGYAGSCSDNRTHHICEDCMQKFTKYLQVNEKQQMSNDELMEFARFVAVEVLDDNFKEKADSFAELACRKLVKLGLVKLDGDTYKEADNE